MRWSLRPLFLDLDNQKVYYKHINQDIISISAASKYLSQQISSYTLKMNFHPLLILSIDIAKLLPKLSGFTKPAAPSQPKLSKSQ
jgi:hypothetical protein